jgi:hypothetical protein
MTGGPGTADPVPDPAPAEAATIAPPPSRPNRLLIAAAVIGVWAVLPPYSGPVLVTETKNEIADHVVPSVLLLSMVAIALAGGYRSPNAMLGLGLGIVLAGVWMTSTHVPLVAQALRGDVGWAATLWHTIPGLVVLGLGVTWAWRYLREDVEGEGR